MALEINVDTNMGLLLENAYVRIGEQSGTKELINIRVRSYVSKEARLEGKQWVDEKIHTFTPDVSDNALNFIKQGYEYLKTLPEYFGAIDA